MEYEKKIAFLVVCNYPKPPYELHGCHNDVKAMRYTLVALFGFEPERVEHELLVDEAGALVMQTGANIMKGLNKMVDKAEEGDVLFFHYSGHGTLIDQHFPAKEEEAIVPCDFNLTRSK